MEINFSGTDLVFMYGHFRKEARKLEELSALPDCPVDRKNIAADINLYSSLADKLRDAYPNLSKMDTYKI